MSDSSPESSAELPTPHAGAGCARPVGAALAALCVVVAATAGLFAGRCSAPPAPPPAASVTIVRPTPNVVTAIRDLSRLESAEFHVERVIDLSEKQSRLFGLLESEDAILLVAAGDVTAGIDLAEIKDGDVSVDSEKKRATITLPPPKILSSRIDNERTYVHSRKTDVLAQRKESLETRARQEAEKSIVEAAKQGGILNRARKNSQRTVETLVRSLGYHEVTVKFRDAPR